MKLERLVFLVAITGCVSNGSTVIVDVTTDFAPGTEFQAVRTQIVDGPEELTLATPGEGSSYLRARRVASFSDGLTLGEEFTLNVELLRPDGSVLATQTRIGTLSSTLAITVVFTRNCQTVECGGGEVCVDGACVHDTCDPSVPASCPDSVLCQTDNDCPRGGLADCAEVSCIRFLCLVEADSSMCEADFYCDADIGCVPPPTPECGASCGGDGACRVGIIECASGSPVCTESNAATNTPCSQDGERGYCDGAGTCVECSPGTSCSVDPCVTGTLDCSGATPVCVAAANLPDGTPCADATFSAWGPCENFAGTCGNTGQRTRTETHMECSSGICASREATGSEECTRNTAGQTCTPTSCGGYSTCDGFTDRCDLGGMQSRTCIDHTCAGGSCGTSSHVEDRSCSRTLSETCGDLIDTDCDGTCDEGCRVPIHRGQLGNDHFNTRTMAELTNAGYNYEGIGFYVYPESHIGLAPLFRCRDGIDHFVTLNSNCEGRINEGVLGYARQPTQPSCGSVPLYRLRWSVGRDHLSTTSEAERASVSPPYALEGVDAQVWTTP